MRPSFPYEKGEGFFEMQNAGRLRSSFGKENPQLPGPGEPLALGPDWEMSGRGSAAPRLPVLGHRQPRGAACRLCLCPFPRRAVLPGGRRKGEEELTSAPSPATVWFPRVSQAGPGCGALLPPRPPALPLPASWCAEQEGPQNGTVPARTCPQLPRAPADPARWGSLRCPQGCGDGLSPPAGFSGG